jgi:hypothetical protein
MDSPLIELGDDPAELAPIRAVEAIRYNGHRKRITIVFGGLAFEIKASRFYKESGRVGEVKAYKREELLTLQKPPKT